MLPGMKRLECLDGLRGLLAVYVLLGHMAPFAVLPDRRAGPAVAWRCGGGSVFRAQRPGDHPVAAATGGRATPFLIARAAAHLSGVPAVFSLAVAVQPWSCGFDHMPWIDARQRGADDLRHGLAAELAAGDPGAPDDDARAVSRTRCCRTSGSASSAPPGACRPSGSSTSSALLLHPAGRAAAGRGAAGAGGGGCGVAARRPLSRGSSAERSCRTRRISSPWAWRAWPW